MTRALAIAALLLMACASTKAPPAPAQVAPQAAVPAENKVAPQVDKPARSMPSECVQACTDGRRMEAMGWEVIVAECEASCAKRSDL